MKSQITLYLTIKIKIMKQFSLFILLIILSLGVSSQNFFNESFNPKKKYLILANPTVRNIKVVQYLVSKELLDINTNKIKFVGLYHDGQKYDFSKTKEYIENKGLNNFYLHEVSGKLTDKNLFSTNECSDELKKVFGYSIGVFFFGGPDIPPSVYNEENTLSVVTDPVRHYFEATFLFHLLGGSQNEGFLPFIEKKPRYFVTGFCLGLQTINVATGGTLIQDIPTEVYNATKNSDILAIGRKNLHRNYWQNTVNDTQIMGINLHTIRFSAHPFFGKTIKMAKGWQPRVYSSHHQAIDELGKGFAVTAWSPDNKIIEGIAHEKYRNVFAVQFHPEVPALYENMYERKFHPEDKPMTYHQMIGRQSVRFHQEYWKHISKVIKKLK